MEANDLKWFLRAKARERRLNVKIILVEITLDAESLTVSYSSATDFRNGSAANLVAGANIEARGSLSSDGTQLVATRITFR